MPTVVAGAVVSGVVGGITVSTVTAGVLTYTSIGIGFSFTSFASSLILGGLSMALAPDAPSAPRQVPKGITRQIRQPVTTRKIVYGEARVSGPMVYVAQSGDNQYFHMILPVAGHEVQEIGEIWLNDVSITDDMLDGSGSVTSGQFSGLVRIKKHLGADNQTADSDLVSEITEWTTTHRLRGVAYVYARFEYDRDEFPSGVPNLSAWVKGKKVTDPRDTGTAWTPNIPLITRDYISWVEYGFGATDDEIADSYTIASANTADEIVEVENDDHVVGSVSSSDDMLTIDAEVLQLHTGDQVRVLSTGTIPGGLSSGQDYYVVPYQRKGTPRIKLATSLENAYAGTTIDITSSGSGTITVRKVGEPRYAGGGVLDTADTLKQNIEKILPTMAGRAIHSDKWYIQAGSYSTPTITLTEDDVVGAITMPTRVSRSERYNTVKGLYSPPHESGLEADFPAYSNSTYVTNDGGTEVTADLNQPFTQRPQHGRRCAKIELERSRQEIVFTTDVRIKQGMLLRAGDTVMVTIDKYGWSSKPFEITSWGLHYREGDEGQGGVPVCPMTLRETASTVFDWDKGEEVTYDPAPNTNLPNPFTVSVVTGFSLDALLIDTQGGDKTFSTVASWDEHPNQFVTQGGEYEVSFKRTTESVYRSAGVVDGTTTEMEIPTLQPDVLYDIQIVAYNNLGVASAPTTIEDYQVGTTATTNTEDWENETLARSGDDWENDTLSSEDWE